MFETGVRSLIFKYFKFTCSTKLFFKLFDMAFQSGKLPVCNAETLANIADPDQVAMHFSADSRLTPQCK